MFFATANSTWLLKQLKNGFGCPQASKATEVRGGGGGGVSTQVKYEQSGWMKVRGGRGREALYICCVYMPTDSSSVSVTCQFEGGCSWVQTERKSSTAWRLSTTDLLRLMM